MASEIPYWERFRRGDRVVYTGRRFYPPEEDDLRPGDEGTVVSVDEVSLVVSWDRCGGLAMEPGSTIRHVSEPA